MFKHRDRVKAKAVVSHRRNASLFSWRDSEAWVVVSAQPSTFQSAALFVLSSKPDLENASGSCRISSSPTRHRHQNKTRHNRSRSS